MKMFSTTLNFIISNSQQLYHIIVTQYLIRMRVTFVALTLALRVSTGLKTVRVKTKN